MPDLLTHAAVGSMLGVAARRRVLVWLVVGSVLPDVISRLPGLAMALASRTTGLPVSYELLQAVGLGHVPLAVLAVCLIIALLLPAPVRSAAFLGLTSGALVHLALDTAQAHLVGGYMLLYPFSTRLFELGLMDAEASLDLLPWTMALAAAALGLRRVIRSRWRRPSAGDQSP